LESRISGSLPVEPISVRCSAGGVDDASVIPPPSLQPRFSGRKPPPPDVLLRTGECAAHFFDFAPG
jgi:hypothetical protein